MNRLFDTLEICLQEIEKGRDLESILSQYPDLADELRPILQTAIKARGISAPEPTSDAQRRGRARVMQHAAELREARSAPRKPVRVIPVFQRLAFSFALLMILLFSGTGILSASASALPGESLYPVKRGWENVRLFLIFDSEARQLLANEFENERLHEVNELLVDGRYETIQFAGVFMVVNGTSYVSGLPVTLPATINIPENGAAVIVTGYTNVQGFIEVTGLELLPAGSVVPAGTPIEVETEAESGPDDDTESRPDSGSGSTGEAQPTPVYFEFQGALQSMTSGTLVVNDMTVYLEDSGLAENLCIGMTVEIKGYYADDGRFIVTEVDGKGSCNGSEAPQNSGSDDTNSNDNTDDNNNDNDSSDDDNSNDDDNDDHSGSGGNDDDDGDDND